MFRLCGLIAGDRGLKSVIYIFELAFIRGYQIVPSFFLPRPRVSKGDGIFLVYAAHNPRMVFRYGRDEFTVAYFNL